MQAIVAYAESFEFNDYLSSNGKDSVETTLCYANTDCSRTISNNNLVVEVALHIVASDIAFYLHRLLHLLIAVACGDILLVCLFQLGDGHYIGLADAAVADTGLVSGLHRLIVVALAGREGQSQNAGQKAQPIKYLVFHVCNELSLQLELICDVQHAVGAVGIVLLRVLRETIESRVTRRGIVRAALLISAGHQMSVVEDVGHHEVDA